MKQASAKQLAHTNASKTVGGNTIVGDLRRSATGVPEITPAWVNAHASNVMLIDVRERDELNGELSCMRCCVHVPLSAVESACESWDRDHAIILVCRSGWRSGCAALQLEKAKFQYVASMAGGMLAWNAHGFPVQSAATTAPTYKSVNEPGGSCG